MILVRTRRNIR